MFITFTGVDDVTNVNYLLNLTNIFPQLNIEFGVLYSKSNAGKGRYPSFYKINEICEYITKNRGKPEQINFALHVCGSSVGDLLDNKEDTSWICKSFDRIQLNFVYPRYSKEQLQKFLNNNLDKRIIFQYNDKNAEICNDLVKNCPNLELLFDKSGGKGIAPDSWPNCISGVRCGYAGGLGPDNINDEFKKINLITKNQNIWLDMETKLRTNDTFDILKVIDVCNKLTSHNVYSGVSDARQSSNLNETVSRFRPVYRALSQEEKQLHDNIKSAAVDLENLYYKVLDLKKSTPSEYSKYAFKDLESSVMWIIKELTSN